MIKYFNEVVTDLKQKGTIFGAEYRKKNGEVTKINGRFGVAKFVKGTGSSNPNVLTVWDNNRKRYTSLIPENIISITTSGYKYTDSVVTRIKQSADWKKI